MSMTTGLIIAVLASLCWGSVDAVRKALAERITPLALATLLAAGKIPGFALWAAVDGSWSIPPAYILPGLGVVVTALIASVLFLWALRLSPLSVSIPMLSLTPAFAVLIAFLLLDEAPTGRQQIGIGAVVTGAFFLNTGIQSVRGGRWGDPGAWIMVAVSALWAAAMTLDKVAMQYTDAPTHGIVHVTLIALLLLLFTVVRGQWRTLAEVRTMGGLYGAAIVLGTLATALQLVAIQVVLVSVVETIKRFVGLTMSVVNGRIFFREPVGRRKVFAIIWMGAGVFLLV